MTTHGQSLRVRRLREAADWLIRLESTTCTEADTLEWLHWCDADPQNVTSFECVQRHWHEMDVMKGAAADVISAQDSQAARVQSWSVFGEWRRWLPLAAVRRVGWSIAASLVVGLTLWMGKHRPSASDLRPRQVASTVINRSATLPDGSKVILGANTLVNVDFTGPLRRLDLAAGEAYFKVQHDRRHPFIVHAGEVSVTAVGTAFDVHRLSDTVTVTVEEGVVEVTSVTPTSGDRHHPATLRAGAGYQVSYSSAKRTVSIASIDPSAILAWRNGELAYVHESLGSVIEDLNRYSARKIIIQDPEIAALPFTGTAFASSVDDWLEAVKQAYPVGVGESETGDIVLTGKH
jgi:transmembrane sensor